MKNFKHSKQGFTIVEVLIVTGITAAIAIVAIVNLAGWKGQRELSGTAQKVAALLREAESRAASQSEGKGWGVRFENSSTSNSSYSLFYYDETGASTTISYNVLPGALSFNSSSLPSDGTIHVFFSQISGKPTVITRYVARTVQQTECLPCTPRPGKPCKPCTATGLTVVTTPVVNTSTSLNLNLLLPRDVRTSSTIKVNETGVIAFDAFTCVFTCSQSTIVLPPLPTLALAATPTSTTAGQEVAITWSSANSTSCSADWVSGAAVSGSATSRPNQTTTYGMTCIGEGGSVTQSVEVQVTTAGGGTPGGGTPGGGGVKPKLYR